jgi:hypothetical protein
MMDNVLVEHSYRAACPLSQQRFRMTPMLKRTKPPVPTLALETQEDFVVSHVIEFESAIAENPPDEETAFVLALTLHVKGKVQLANAAFEHLERCIETFPEQPSNATNQVRLCLLSAGYLFVGDQIERDTIVAQDEALKYVRYASDNSFWDHPLLLCVTSLLSGQWFFGQRAKEMVATKVDEWISGGNRRAVAQAAMALEGQLSPKHELALKEVYEHLNSIEDLSWYLIALKKSGDRFYELQKKVAQTILDQLRLDSFIQSVLRSGSLAYLLSYPQLISAWQESGLIHTLCRQTIIRNAYVDGDTLICELREEAWDTGPAPLVPFEVALATYALVYTGFNAIRGVRLNDAPALIDVIKQASEVKAGYLLVSPIKRHLYNLSVTLTLVFISMWVLRLEQDVNSSILPLLVTVLKALFVLAPVGAITGWIVKGDALGGLWNFILEQTGQK